MKHGRRGRIDLKFVCFSQCVVSTAFARRTLRAMDDFLDIKRVTIYIWSLHEARSPWKDRFEICMLFTMCRFHGICTKNFESHRCFSHNFGT